MNKFCHNCGKQMPSVAAKFCPFCGTSLLSLSSTPAPAIKAPNSFTPFSPNADDDDDSYIDRLTHLDIKLAGLQIDVTAPPKVQGEKLGTFAASAPLDTSNSRGEGQFAGLSPEQAQQLFKQEAGSRVEGTKIRSIEVDEKK